jgi:primosomal protein N' (replication factor Y)
MKYADVIVPLSVAGTFTYEIPDDLQAECQVGKRVIVQFGRRKYYTAIVLNIHSQKPDYQTKTIFSIIDTKPIVNQTNLELWKWIAEYYMCNLGDVYTAAVPISLRIESQTQISLTKDIIDTQLSKNEQIIIDKLKEQKTLTIGEVEKIINVKNIN